MCDKCAQVCETCSSTSIVSIDKWMRLEWIDVFNGYERKRDRVEAIDN